MGRARYCLVALAALLSLVPPVALTAHRAAAMGPAISITDPSSSTTIGEGYDFATFAWGNPWDMDSLDDVYYWGNISCGNPYPQFNSIGIANGVWHGQVAAIQPHIFLLEPGYAEGSIALGRDGLFKPIDAGRYYRLTFRMKLDYTPPGSAGVGYIRYSDGSFENQTDPAHWSLSHPFKMYADNQWHIYSLDLRAITPGTGALAWMSGKWMTALAIVPDFGTGATVYLDWARLSNDFVGQRVAWSGSYQTTATVQLGLGNATDGFVPLHVYEPGEWQGWYFAPTAIYALNGSFMLYGGLGQGDYTVRATVTDGTGTTTSSPAGPYVVRAAPWAAFTKPGYMAGSDWATDVSGDPWDMDVANSADILEYPYMVSFWEYVNSGGSQLYHALSQDVHQVCVALGDPQLKLRMHGSTINSHDYRWLTIRMWVEGTPDLGAGSVARVSWWGDGWTPCGETNDIRLKHGWNTYSIDLHGDVVEPGGVCTRHWLSQNWRYLRIDPLEIPVPTSFWIDYVYLARDTKANTSVELVWEEHAQAGSSLALALYYDTNLDPSSGRVLITTGGLEQTPALAPWADAPSCTLPFCVYLPILRGGISPSLCTSGVCRYVWNTTQLPEGQYYLYVESFDGYSTIGRYSDTPVVVDR